MSENISENAPTPRRVMSPRLSKALLVLLCALAAGFGLFVSYLNAPPAEFPAAEQIVIEHGSNLNDIGTLLESERVIRSAFLFRAIIRVFGNETSIQAGVHAFPEPQTTYRVARSFADRSSSVPPAKITIPEGATLADFDALISAALPRVQAGDIVRRAGGKEGTLFPDTYLVSLNATADDVVTLLTDTFAQKLETRKDALARSVLSKEEVIVLASIVEKEGNDAESMAMVAGILLKRLELRMPLQADATFAYVLGKGSAQLTVSDLEIDSPFNTYNNRGLPPSPIASPGLTAIDAVLNPTESEYLYYLTDTEGVFHYARTFDEHKRNKAKYLR